MKIKEKIALSDLDKFYIKNQIEILDTMISSRHKGIFKELIIVERLLEMDY
jgi:hypothetical protein